MQFISTRGQAPETSFSDVLLAGLAPDGGLYLPQRWPQISKAEIAAFKGQRYQDVAFAILSRFTAGSFSDGELREAIEAAYSDFDAPEIAPLTDIGNGQYLLELFHGPTLAFKDIALQVLGQLFSRALAKRGGRATIVAATSGDTGSAAIAALGGLPNINVFVMHPKGRVSDVQRLQMTTSAHANVHNIALEGSFDDAQSIVKLLFADTAFADQISLTAVNSINFARIAAQCVYYFTATAALGRPATFVVPTGNFGDIFAGEAAQRMGLDVARLVIATNANDIMARALNEGVYAAGASHATLSPSMDIQVASNFERALFEASGRDPDWTAAAMNDFSRNRKLELHFKLILAHKIK
ncbi:MAG: threonine synthase, partial [Pseudomonadota bacterium]